MRRLLPLAFVAAVFAASCSGGAAVTAPEDTTSAPASTATVQPAEPEVPETPSLDQPEPTPPATPAPEQATPTEPEPAPAPAEEPPNLVATATADVEVFDVPDGSVAHVFAPQTGFGSTTTFAVRQDLGDWLHVSLPVRPNGSTGFVRKADVQLTSVDYRVEVDVAARTLTLLDGDAVTLQTAVAVGSAENPTPLGEFYITDLLATPGESSPYGPFAMGVSAHSDTLSEFGGGDGQIGIHGTNDPASIGHPVSHGCVRVPNDVITQLAAMLPLGTPVVIV